MIKFNDSIFLIHYLYDYTVHVNYTVAVSGWSTKKVLLLLLFNIMVLY